MGEEDPGLSSPSGLALDTVRARNQKMAPSVPGLWLHLPRCGLQGQKGNVGKSLGPEGMGVSRGNGPLIAKVEQGTSLIESCDTGTLVALFSHFLEKKHESLVKASEGVRGH